MSAHQRTRRKIYHAVYEKSAFDHPWIGQHIAWTALGTQRGNTFTFSDRTGVIILFVPANVPPRTVWDKMHPVAPKPHVFPDASCKPRFVVMLPSDRKYKRVIDQFLFPYCSALSETNIIQ